MPILVLLRHGQSVWNLENRFTGWVDVDISERGVAEAIAAGQMLRDEGIRPDAVFMSVQKRAIRTADLALAQLGGSAIRVERAWELNERHYGALQGLDKKETTQQYGEQQVNVWRRSYATPPPPMSDAAWAEQRRDPTYAMVPDDALPRSECLADVVARMMPYWERVITPELADGKLVLIVAHGNSLRALVKHLDGLSEAAIVGVNIPTGSPLVYELGTSLETIGSQYLGDPDAVQAAIDTVARQAE